MSNGANWGTEYGLLEYQCVAYAKRFYTKLLDTSKWTGLASAYQYYTNAEARGLTPYPNGGSMSPQPDDILSFRGGTNGHVAIITEVGENYVNVIEQNVKRNDAMGPPNHQIPYNKATNMIGDENGLRTDIGLYVQGWIRKDAWSFNDGKMDNLNMAERWEAHYVESSSVGTDGKYRIDPGIDPWIQHDGLSLDSNNYNAIEINMASNAPDGMGKIYFTTSGSSTYDENKHIDFYATNDGNWRTYTVYMKNHPWWSGTIIGIRIDPATTGKPGTDNTDIIGFD
ncbi:CHAP domain-containing protein [Patescibacteria group bacterium]|nr:CHAP domain-containing protein [Patescibacteria group bacterium]